MLYNSQLFVIDAILKTYRRYDIGLADVLSLKADALSWHSGMVERFLFEDMAAWCRKLSAEEATIQSMPMCDFIEIIVREFNADTYKSTDMVKD